LEQQLTSWNPLTEAIWVAGKEHLRLALDPSIRDFPDITSYQPKSLAHAVVECASGLGSYFVWQSTPLR